ncbi:MAG: DUF1016 family protein [Bacilli bacterium]|nr:DUF1016 family protein [Bacilli bacterium]
MNFYNEIKQELINNEIYKKVKDYSKNRSDLMTYYNVGKILIEAQGGEERAKYGNSLIKKYSKKLVAEVDKKYGERNLRNMRKFYLIFKDEIWNAVRTNLSWTHFRVLLTLNNFDEINYYIELANKQNLGYRELETRIKNNEYERLPNNTKEKMIEESKLEIQDLIKNPIVISSNGREIVSEKILKQLILEDLDNFLKELGPGFSYIESEYKIKIENRYNYIDILLYNFIYNCYVVVELKVTELKKEHLGQIQFYMNYIDKNLKLPSQDKTIGIIITKKGNDYVIEYSSDDRIYKTSYILN